MAIVRGNVPTPVGANNVTSVSPTKPTGLANGDVVIIALAFAVGDTPSPPSGAWGSFTEITHVVQASTTITLWAWWHVVTVAASEPASYTITWTTNSRATGFSVAYSGVDTTTPMDVATPSTATAGTGGTLAAPSITTVTDGAMLIGGGGQNSSGANTSTPPGTMTKFADAPTAGKGSALADESQATAGATGTRTWSFSSTTLGHAVWLAALRPTTGSSATATPAAVAATVSIPAPTVTVDATVSPGVVAATVSVPAPTVTTGGGSATVTPATVAATASIPAPTVTVRATVTPAVVSATASIPAPAVTVRVSVSPVALAAAATIPAPSVTAGGNATATPNTVAATASVPAPTVRVDAVVTLTTVNGVAAVLSPTVVATSGATATPTTVAASAVIPSVAVSAAGVQGTGPRGVASTHVGARAVSTNIRRFVQSTPSRIQQGR